MENDDNLIPEQNGWVRFLSLDYHNENDFCELKYWICSKAHSELHRENGPAETLWFEGNNFVQSWYLWGKRHRLNGPAIIWDNKHYRNEWWVDGTRLSEEKENLLNYWYQKSQPHKL